MVLSLCISDAMFGQLSATAFYSPTHRGWDCTIHRKSCGHRARAAHVRMRRSRLGPIKVMITSLSMLCLVQTATTVLVLSIHLASVVQSSIIDQSGWNQFTSLLDTPETREKACPSKSLCTLGPIYKYYMNRIKLASSHCFSITMPCKLHVY